MEIIVLGLDIGIGSVGWGLVKLQEQDYLDEVSDAVGKTRQKIVDGQIIASGVRTFQPPHNKDKKSLAKIRGEARRTRKTIRRKRQRLRKLVRLGKEFGLIEKDFNRDLILKPRKGDSEKRDIWWLRKEAVERDKPLTNIELFKILYHIAKHRGFHFHTKAEEKAEEEKGSEAGKVKVGLSRVKNKLSESNYDTVGQMYYYEFSNNYKDAKGLPRKDKKHNSNGNYEHSIHRLMLKEEVEKIFEKQQQLKSKFAKKELLEKYINDVLMHEEGIDDRKLQEMMGDCEFEPGEKCAPKEGYTSERFTMINQLNNLELIDTNNKDEHVKLDDSQRKKIIELAYKNVKVNYAQIRKELGLGGKLELRFNLCSYREKDPEYVKKLECKIVNGRLQFEDKHVLRVVNIKDGDTLMLDKEIKAVFKGKELWKDAKKIGVYYSDIRRHIEKRVKEYFGEDTIWRFDISGYTKSVEEFGGGSKGLEKYINQFEKDGVFVELKGYHKIRRVIVDECGEDKWKEYADDIEKLDVIAESLTYCKSDDTRAKYLKDKGINDCSVINAVLGINMSQLANFSKTAMRKITKVMEDDRLFFHEAKDKCGYIKVEYDRQVTLKPYKGFYEKNPVVARVVSQTRKVVNAIVRKYGRDYPIDQINIEVATDLAVGNKRKSEIYFGQQRYKEAKKAAEQRCNEFGLDPEEGQNLLRFRLAEEQEYRCPYTGKAITRHSASNDNEVYILDCEIDHIIPMSRSFNDSMNNKVLCAPEANQEKKDRIPYEWFGEDAERWHRFEKQTMKLIQMPYPKRVNLCRKGWTKEQQDKFISRNINDTRYATRHISDYMRKYFDFSGSSRTDIKDVSRVQLRSGGVTAFMRHVWGLNKDRDANDLHHAVDALVVACSTNGHVYFVSNLSKNMERKGKNWYKHFAGERYKAFRPWGSVRSDIIDATKDIFVSRMPRHTVTAAGHEAKIAPKTSIPKNRVIKVNEGYAKIGTMVRADVFVDDKGKNYIVPIYAIDMFANKPLPNKYICSGSYDKWPTVEEKRLSFRFSLFKDDLVRINGVEYYIRHIETDGRIAVKKVSGAPFGDKEQDRISYKSVDIKKLSVDILGNYKEIEEEKRLGNRFETAKKSCKKMV